MKKVLRTMMKDQRKNAHGICIKRCCASCRRKRITDEDGRMCSLSREQVESCHCCKEWTMHHRLQNAGNGVGKVKSWQYLTYYREVYLEQREALAEGRIGARQVLSWKQIRKLFEAEHESIFVDM